MHATTWAVFASVVISHLFSIQHYSQTSPSKYTGGRLGWNKCAWLQSLDAISRTKLLLLWEVTSLKEYFHSRHTCLCKHWSFTPVMPLVVEIPQEWYSFFSPLNLCKWCSFHSCAPLTNQLVKVLTHSCYCLNKVSKYPEFQKPRKLTQTVVLTMEQDIRGVPTATQKK